MNIKLTSDQMGEFEWLELKPNELGSTEAEDIEKVTELTFAQWGQQLMNGSALCGRALVWVLLKRQNPGLRFRNVHFRMNELDISLDDDEKRRIREELKKNDDMSDEEKRDVLIALGEPELNHLDFDPDEDEANQGNSQSTAEKGDDSG